jgi:hypothetical protein
MNFEYIVCLIHIIRKFYIRGKIPELYMILHKNNIVSGALRLRTATKPRTVLHIQPTQPYLLSCHAVH